jgi:formylmethanofuran dehydrogenase subunit E
LINIKLKFTFFDYNHITKAKETLIMKYPDFFDKVPAIRLQDPLSDFLGAFESGELEITYLDCVKLAGHSCPTVAGAYLMAKKGLESLYDDTLPQRGEIHVSMREAEDQGVAGVIGNVVAFIVGAGGIGGFKGIGGHFPRNNLLTYNTPMEGDLTLTRIDTQKSITLSYSTSMVPGDPKMQPLMGKSLQGLASSEERKQFAVLWQTRVEKILLSETLWDQMITTTKG